MVKPPYVAYVKPTGIKFIALDKQNKHKTIETTQKIVGKTFVKPLVVFKKPLAEIPSITAKNKYMYPDEKFTRLYYFIFDLIKAER